LSFQIEADVNTRACLLRNGIDEPLDYALAPGVDAEVFTFAVVNPVVGFIDIDTRQRGNLVAEKTGGVDDYSCMK
jgi:hypothetical protein